MPSRSWAGIAPITQGTTNVSGVVIEGPPNQNPTQRQQYNDGTPLVEGLQPVHASISRHAEIPPGSSTPNASASSFASQDTLINFDAGRDLLELNSTNVVRTDTTLVPPTQTRVNQGHAEAQSAFSTSLHLTDHAYDYGLTLGDFFLNHQGPVPEAGFARVELLSNATGKDVFFREFSLFDGTTSSTGSLAGTLAPGDYRFSIDLFGPTSGAGGHTDGRLVAGLSVHGAAPEIKWASPTGGSFQTATDWDPRRVPGASDRAAFDLPGTYTVTLDADVTNDRLRVNGANVNVTFDLAGHNYTVDQLNIGGQPGDSGTFTIKDSGGISVSAARAAAAPLKLLRANSMTLDGNVDIAAAMTSASVLVANGARVSASGAAAVWTIDELLVKKGTVALSNGAAIESRRVELGTDLSILPEDVATATVTGRTGWTTNELIVGSLGTGSLTVSNQGGLEFQRLTVGATQGSTGTVTVDGTAGVHESGAGPFIIGDKGTGHFKVQNGANVQSVQGTLTIGASTGGAGDVSVLSNGNLFVASLNVGPAGTGALTVGGGGLVAVSPAQIPGSAVVGTHGTVSVNANGMFTSDHLLQVDGTFSVNGASGQAIVGDDPGNLPRGRMFIRGNGTLSGTGTIFANVSLGGNVAFRGHIGPAHSPGTLTIAGEFEEQAEGVLDIEIAGTAPGQFDVLKVDADPATGLLGNATIGGDLTLTFLDGFAPRAGDRFDFLTAAGALTGQFQHVEVFNLAPGFRFDLRNEGGRFTMVAQNDGTAVPEPPAAALLLLSGVPLARRRRPHSPR